MELSKTFPAILIILLCLPTGGSGQDIPAPNPDPIHLPSDDALTPTEADIGWRWIYHLDLPGLPCEEIPGWSESLLFPGVDDLELKRFCLYEAVSGIPPGPPPVTSSGRAGTDRIVVRRAGQQLATAIWQGLAEQFHDQAGAYPHSFAPLVQGNKPTILLMDTSPNGTYSLVSGIVGNSPHGYSLLHKARSLLCDFQDPSTCMAEISSRLSLPFLSVDLDRIEPANLDFVNGGRFGRLSDLATSVVEAIATTTGNRIVSLSVAWNSVFSEPCAEKEPVAVAAVRLALDYAKREGALIIAAAGNNDGGPEVDSKGPMYPAAWESAQPPFNCRNHRAKASYLLSQTDRNAPLSKPVARDESQTLPGPPSPLVHAVGAVGHSGRPLFNSRIGGMPRLAAYGSHAVAEGHISGVPTAILTGSSVSTLVVSAAAAAIWYNRPGLTADEVMDYLYASGDDLPMQADFCAQGPPCGSIRRISLCRAVAFACSAPNSQCSNPPHFCNPWPSPLPGSLHNIILPAIAGGSMALDPEDVGQLSNCGNSYQVHIATPLSGSPNPAPHLQFHGLDVRPWVVEPQPRRRVCPGCTIKKTGGPLVILEPYPEKSGGIYELFIQIDNEFPWELHDLTISEGTRILNVGTVPVLNREPGSPNGPRILEWKVAFHYNGAGPVTLSFTVKDGATGEILGSSVNPVTILP